MEVHVTGELEAKLTDSAAREGPRPDDLVKDALTRYFEKEARFVQAVKRGGMPRSSVSTSSRSKSASVSSVFYKRPLEAPNPHLRLAASRVRDAY